jgi:ABC-type amino acid transport substrate-binding protein
VDAPYPRELDLDNPIVAGYYRPRPNVAGLSLSFSSMPTKLKELNEEIEAGKALWELLVTLAQKHPVVSFLLVFVVLFIVGVQLRTFWTTVSTDYAARPGLVLGAVALLAVGAIILTGFLATRPPAVVRLLLPPAGSDIIGESVTVTWGLAYRDANDEKPANQVSYVVQYRSGGTTHDARNFVQYQAFQPPEGQFEWRVRATAHDGEAQEFLSDWSPWQTNYFYRSARARIRMTGTLRVGVSKDYLEPFVYYNETLNGLDGIDIRVIQSLRPLLAKALGVPTIDAKYIPNAWLEGNSDDLGSGATDIAIGDTSIVPERETKYHIKFTKPYWFDKMALVSYRTRPIKDISTTRLTAWRGTTYEQVAQQLTSTYESSTNIPEMLDKLAQGKVDGFIDAAEIAAKSAAQNALSKLTIRVLSQSEVPAEFAQRVGYPSPTAIYVKESEIDLLDELNRILSSPEETAALARIQAEFVPAAERP